MVMDDEPYGSAEEIDDAVEHKNLKRDNAILLKAVGLLGLAVLSLGGSFLAFWVNSISGKFDAQQAQLGRQWEQLNQRGERLNQLETRFINQDALTTEYAKILRGLERDMERVKVRLKMDGN